MSWISVHTYTYVYLCMLGNSFVDNNGMATVTISDLQCEVTYALIAEGMSNGKFVGSESFHGIITTGPCPVMASE